MTQASSTPAPHTFDSTAASVSPRRRAGVTAIVAAAIVCSVYPQRFVVTEYRINVTFILMIVIVFVALLFNLAWVTKTRLLAATGLLTVAGAATLASSLWSPFTPSVESLLVLVITWSCLVVVVSPSLPLKTDGWDTIFLWAILPLAFAIILQVALQFTSVGWLDPIMSLPDSIRYRKLEYSVTYEYVYGTGLNKPNGFFFVEPSMASQYMAIGALAALARRPVWAIPFGIALALTASGTGIIAFVIGLPFVFGRASLRVKSLLLVGGGAAVTVLLASPLGALLTERSNEFVYQNSSGSARFIAPFDAMIAAFQQYPMAVLTGFGPGSSDELRGALGYSHANLSLIPKSVLEYGLIFTVAFSLAIAAAILAARGVSLANRIAMLLIVFFLSGALIQGFTALLAWSVVFASSRRSDSPAPPNAMTPATADPAAPVAAR